MVVVNDNDLEDKADISLIAPNDEPYSIGDVNNINWNYKGQRNRGIQEPNRGRVKYHPSYSKNRWMVVEGRLNNGRKYPVVLDTGTSLALFVNDIHILENKLVIYPLRTNNDDSVSWGMSRLPKLSIGQVTLVNWLCFYRGQHAEVQMFGLPIARDKSVIMGLVALREFKYIVFDNVKHEAEFSLEEIFEPRNSDLWTQYRSEEHTSELQSHSFISYAVFCLKKKNKNHNKQEVNQVVKQASCSFSDTKTKQQMNRLRVN